MLIQRSAMQENRNNGPVTRHLTCAGVVEEQGGICGSCAWCGNRQEAVSTIGKWAFRGHSIDFWRMKAFGTVMGCP